ncbi:MAG: hypothetical protein DLM65_05245 [Candidatus Aeolococcus gillhamiae]|uniref:Antibiotic biosynthesis monooxygenase n=1 Tax=Candidatus Aeolococcus gillhamiae TaxID=3127015 RepID=A0A2W5ZD02_9BACT|nr:MAG: hypothetical protein DLM65_05245 [Candidatus Dormibacter sp. RRmetagenome_bin12]
MAVAFLFEAEGADGSQYDEVMRGIGRAELDSDTPEGIISHIAGPTATGWRVVDVWESEEQAGRFYGSESFQKAASILPAMQQHSWQLHRLETYKAVRATGA